MSEKLYKIEPPLGNTLLPKEVMTEKEIRAFMPQLIQEPEVVEIWKEKAEKDPIETVIEYMRQAGYVITEQ